MKAREVAELLMKTPDTEVVIRVSNDWCEVVGVGETGVHRNAVTFLTYEQSLPGVIVVEPDMP